MALGSDPRVERICRTICYSCGFDPDAPVIYGEGRAPEKGPYGSIVVTTSRPAWQTYIRLAEDIVREFDCWVT